MRARSSGRRTGRSSSRESPYDTEYRRPGKMPRVPGYGRAGRCYGIPDRARALPAASGETCSSSRAACDSSCIPQCDWPDVQRRMGRLSRYGTACRSRCAPRGGKNDSGSHGAYGSRCIARHPPGPCGARAGQTYCAPPGGRTSRDRASSAAGDGRAQPGNAAHDNRYRRPRSAYARSAGTETSPFLSGDRPRQASERAWADSARKVISPPTPLPAPAGDVG